MPSVLLLWSVRAQSSLQPARLVVDLGESRVLSFASSNLLFWWQEHGAKAVFSLCNGHSLYTGVREE